MTDMTPKRLQELRRIAEAAVPGKWSGQDFQLAMTPRTALALLDRIEALEAFVHADKACRDHAVTCSYYDWKPGACPDGVCKRLMRARDEAYRRALAVMDIADGGATHA